MDALFIETGSANGQPLGSGFQGVVIGDYTLLSLYLFTVGGQDYLPDQTLPGTLQAGSLRPAGSGGNDTPRSPRLKRTGCEVDLMRRAQPWV